MGVDEAGVERAGRDLRAFHQRAQEGQIGLRPDHDGVVELPVEQRQRFRPGRRMDDELGDHRVVEGGHAVAGGDAGIDPDSRQTLLAPEAHRQDPPGRGQEIVLGVLGVDAGLDRRAVAGDVILSQRQRLARGDAELPFHEIEPGHRLGDRMLDLQPGVHLEKEEVAGPSPREASAMNSTVPAPT